MSNIPEILNDFNVYKDGNKLIGIAAEVTLPDFEAMTETISGAGILGEYEVPNPGHFGAMEIEVPFRVLYGDIFELLDTAQDTHLTLRGSIQTTDAGGTKAFKGVRVVLVGTAKKLTGGTMAAGKPMEASVALGLSYIKIEVDGAEKVELDKRSGTYKVNGSDKLGAIKALC
jgi:P2 family phage contractile tail tube protein